MISLYIEVPLNFGEGCHWGTWSALKRELELLIRSHFIASLMSSNKEDKVGILLPDSRTIFPFNSLEKLWKRSLAIRWAPAESSLEVTGKRAPQLTQD